MLDAPTIETVAKLRFRFHRDAQLTLWVKTVRSAAGLFYSHILEGGILGSFDSTRTARKEKKNEKIPLTSFYATAIN